jgi:hypothetical protein
LKAVWRDRMREKRRKNVEREGRGAGTTTTKDD